MARRSPLARKFVIFGNSGSGKTTLARHYAEKYALSYLDLDTVAWESAAPPRRKAREESIAEIRAFMHENPTWVIEGVYGDLLETPLAQATRVFFMNPGVDACVANCEDRPWEPHKYETPEAQDRNLPMLIEWVRRYPQRDDEYALSTHRRLFDSFAGEKEEITRRNHKMR